VSGGPSDAVNSIWKDGANAIRRVTEVLTSEENALLCRVEGDAPAGILMRRYWHPVLMAEEVAEPAGAPVCVRLVGRDYVVFRDTDGQLGMLDARCRHLNTRSYALREAGSLVWAYVGPPEREPPFPAFDWTTLPAEQIALIKLIENVNYAQATEGAIDTAHSQFLHRGILPDEKLRGSISADTSPRLEAEDTNYGFRYAAIRRTAAHADTQKWVRVTNYVFPTIVLVPRPLDASVWSTIQIFVPLDDTKTMHYTLVFREDGAPADAAAFHAYANWYPGVTVDEKFRLDATEANGWKQDRVAMKDGSLYTGLLGFVRQDVGCQESMGPIVDRTREHLGTSDVAIIRMRRRMLENIRRVMAGVDPIGIDGSVDYPRLRSEQRVIGINEPWQQIGAFAGEYA
jgi:phthalate 4,5-dioxygenase oxygenase subunit